MDKSFLKEQNINSKEIEDDIDFSRVLYFFVRNKKFVIFSSLLFFLIGFLSSFFFKKVWEGQFQIVLDNKDSNSLSALKALDGSFLSEISGFSKPQNDLKTEVGILESQSVLLPIFDKFVEDKGLTFDEWKGSLKINLKKNTSILQISYRDTNRELIIPVLSEISKKYQDYSSRSEKRSNELGIQFLKSQIEIYKDRSSRSFKDAQSYAIDQDLDTFGFYSESNNEKNLIEKETFMSNTGIEKIRVNAANQIRDINLQIEKIKSLGSNSKKIKYLGATIYSLKSDDLTLALRKIEDSLIDLKSKFTEDDIQVRRMYAKRDMHINLLKERAIGILEAKRLSTEAIMEASMRPKEVLLEYKELIRQANRDESTLIKLENQLRIMEIEDSKLQDPWELITIPTLNERPVAPSKRKIGIIGLLIGFLIGILKPFIQEKKSGLIFEEGILESYLNAKIITKFKLNGDKINLIPNQIPLKELINNLDSLNLIYTNNLNKNLKDDFHKFLTNNISDNSKSIKITNLKDDLSVISNDTYKNDLVLITSLDNLKKDELRNLRNRLDVLKINLFSIFLIET